jgi:hypothetical protein
MIVDTLGLSAEQVEAAIRYIEEHRDEVMADHAEMRARDARGNPPELRAKLDRAHERLQAKHQELRAAQSRDAQDAWHSGGH